MNVHYFTSVPHENGELSQKFWRSRQVCHVKVDPNISLVMNSKLQKEMKETSTYENISAVSSSPYANFPYVPTVLLEAIV